MLIIYGTYDYWKRVREIDDWEKELKNGVNTKPERREMIVIIKELKDALESDTYGKF